MRWRRRRDPTERPIRINAGRTALIAIVALSLGFVGGVWFIGSGVGFRLIPEPTVAPVVPGRPPAKARPGPLVKAVAVPKTAYFSGGSAGLVARANRTDLLPAPGCDWAIEPRPFRLGGTWHSVDPERAIGGYSAIDPASGGLRYLLVQSTRQGASAVDLRPVFFDADAHREGARRQGGGSSRGSGGAFDMAEFYLDPVGSLTPARVAYFGIERVAPNAARLLVEAAQEEAKQKGMTILPAPLLGQPYAFDLPATDGKRLRSEDLRGKPVLVAIWGPGGLSSIGLMTVKNVLKANPEDEIAIVGVSYDGSVEDARSAFAKMGPDGHLVVVPNDPTTRRIWSDGAQITELPKFLLIDREGVLRFTCRSFDLQDRVDILFGRAKHPRFPRPLPTIKPPHKTPKVPPIAPAPTPRSSPAPRPGIRGSTSPTAGR